MPCAVRRDTLAPFDEHVLVIAAEPDAFVPSRPANGVQELRAVGAVGEEDAERSVAPRRPFEDALALRVLDGAAGYVVQPDCGGVLALVLSTAAVAVEVDGGVPYLDARSGPAEVLVHDSVQEVATADGLGVEGVGVRDAPTELVGLLVDDVVRYVERLVDVDRPVTVDDDFLRLVGTRVHLRGVQLCLYS